MKDYKILENRPELTKEQLKQGMDFNKIKMNAAAAQKILLKSLIIKGITGVAVISSGILLYTMVNYSTTEIKSANPVDTVVKLHSIVSDSSVITEKVNRGTITNIKNKNIHDPSGSSINLLIDTPEKNTLPFQIDPSEPMNRKISEKEEKAAHDSLTQNQNMQSDRSYSQKAIKTKRCRIWHSNNLCELPKTAKFIYSIDCDACDFNYIDCQEASQIKDITAVWLTIIVNEKSNFQIKSQLKNITLVKKGDNKPQYPLMIGLNNDGKFLSANFKAKNYTAHYNKQVDIFLFFSNAQVGDKIIIDNFIEALIEE